MAPKQKKKYAKLRQDFKDLFGAKLPRGSRRTRGQTLRRRIALKIGGCCVMIDIVRFVKYKDMKEQPLLIHGTGVVLENNLIVTCTDLLMLLPDKININIGKDKVIQVSPNDKDLQIEPSFKIYISTNAGEPKVRTGELIEADSNLNLAALKLRPSLPLLPQATLAACNDIVLGGESLYCLSNQGGIHNCFFKGFVVCPDILTLMKSYTNRFDIEHDVLLDIGSSGEALFTTNLEVVAINLAVQTNDPDARRAVKVSHIRRFLRKVQALEV